jgi:hypothetical protein
MCRVSCEDKFHTTIDTVEIEMIHATRQVTLGYILEYNVKVN